MGVEIPEKMLGMKLILRKVAASIIIYDDLAVTG